MLSRDYDSMHTQSLTCCRVVLYGNLALGVGTQIGHLLTLATDDSQLLQDNVREDKRSGHILACLVAGIAEHNTLVAGTLLLVRGTHNALVDIRRLLVDSRKDTARRSIELILAAVVTYAVDDATCHALHIDIRLGTHLARHDNKSCGAKGLASYF